MTQTHFLLLRSSQPRIRGSLNRWARFTFGARWRRLTFTSREESGRRSPCFDALCLHVPTLGKKIFKVVESHEILFWPQLKFRLVMS